LFSLSRESIDDLARFCEPLTKPQEELLRRQIDQVLADPSGQREPKHRFTRPFRVSGKVAFLPKGQRAFEFKTNRCRAVFLVDSDARELQFIQVAKRMRFLTPSECPWH
jgi:hypothetical protein